MYYKVQSTVYKSVNRHTGDLPSALSPPSLTPHPSPSLLTPLSFIPHPPLPFYTSQPHSSHQSSSLTPPHPTPSRSHPSILLLPRSLHHPVNVSQTQPVQRGGDAQRSHAHLPAVLTATLLPLATALLQAFLIGMHC